MQAFPECEITRTVGTTYVLISLEKGMERRTEKIAEEFSSLFYSVKLKALTRICSHRRGYVGLGGRFL